MTNRTPKPPGKGRPRNKLPDNWQDTLAGRVAHHVMHFRKSEGLTVAECAERADVTPTKWYRLESGECPLVAVQMLDVLSQLFQMDFSRLVGKPRASRLVVKRKAKR
tara:strand:- start:2315 stop:2635 length:321 start_codon:yes stop_codon:yes gene_type:complete